MMNLPRVKNRIHNCKCGKASVEQEFVDIDLYDVFSLNCQSISYKGYTEFNCIECGGTVESAKMDSAMIGTIEVKTNENVFEKKMPRSVSNIVAVYDFKTEKSEHEVKAIKGKTFIGSDENHDYYINRQSIALSFEQTLFVKDKEYQKELAGLLNNQLRIHAEIPNTFERKSDATRTRVANWIVDLIPLEQFLVAMNVLNVKVTLTNK